MTLKIDCNYFTYIIEASTGRSQNLPSFS